MGSKPGRKKTAATASLIVACLLVSAASLTIAVADDATSAQLQALVTAAQSSKSYASGLVAKAASHSLDVTSEKALLASGDSLLARAQADLSSSSNLTAGIQDAHAAMQDYTGAAVGSSQVLQQAGLTTAVDLSAAADAEAEVNASATLVTKFLTQACVSISVGSVNASLFQESCTEAKSDIVNATVDLGVAASLIAQVGANATAPGDISQAFAILAQAREDVNASATELATISSFTYYQRGESYYSQELLGLYVAANASITSQQEAVTTLSGVQTSFAATVQAWTKAGATLTALESAVESGSALTQSVSSSASASVSTASQVNSNLTYLGSIVTGLSGSAPLVSAINAAQVSVNAYANSAVSANETSSFYASVPITGFSGYLSGLDTMKQDVQTAGQSYISDYTSVQVQLQALINSLGALAPPALRAANATLSALRSSVSSTEGLLNQELTSETEAMSTVQTAITSTISAFRPSSGLVVNASTVQAMVALSSQESVYLNSTSAPVVESATTSIQSTANLTESFLNDLNSSLAGTIGGFEGSISLLATAGVSVGNGASSTTTDLTNAATVVETDLATRTDEVAAANVQVTTALRLFSNLDVSAGVSAMLGARADFQAASTTY